MITRYDYIQRHIEFGTTYDYANPYDITSMVETSEPFTKLIDQLYVAYYFATLTKVKSPKAIITNIEMVKKCLASLVWNLYLIQKEDVAKYMYISRNENDYAVKSEYNTLDISSRIIEVMDHMVEHKLISKQKGYHDKEAKKGKVSRIRPNWILGEKLLDLPDWLATDYSLKSVINYTLAKDKKRKLIEYPETDYTNGVRKILTDYNTELMDGVEISMKGNEGHRFDFTDKNGDRSSIDLRSTFLHAVFHKKKDGSLTYGRMHSPWQQIPSKYRDGLLINGQPTTCYDYSGIIVNALASKEGVQLPDDPYDVPVVRSYITPEKHRAIVKLAMVMMINNPSKKKTSCALAKDLNKEPDLSDGEKKQNKAIASEYLNAIEHKYSNIKHLFYKDNGCDYFKEDSDLARDIIAIFIKEGIPILPIHDGFIVQRQHHEFLRKIMNGAWKSKFGTTIGIKLEGTAPEAIQAPLVDVAPDITPTPIKPVDSPVTNPVLTVTEPIKLVKSTKPDDDMTEQDIMDFFRSLEKIYY